MTDAQADLLRRLIRADRAYHSKARYKECTLHHDWRGIEVGGPFGVNPRTAQSLVDLGLAEMHSGHSKNAFIYLGKIAPVDLMEPEERY